MHSPEQLAHIDLFIFSPSFLPLIFIRSFLLSVLVISNINILPVSECHTHTVMCQSVTHTHSNVAAMYRTLLNKTPAKYVLLITLSI